MNIGSRKKRVVFFLLPIFIYIYIIFGEKLLRQWFPDLKPSIPLTFNGTILDYFGDQTLGGHYGIAYY